MARPVHLSVWRLGKVNTFACGVAADGDEGAGVGAGKAFVAEDVAAYRPSFCRVSCEGAVAGVGDRVARRFVAGVAQIAAEVGLVRRRRRLRRPGRGQTACLVLAAAGCLAG